MTKVASHEADLVALRAALDSSSAFQALVEKYPEAATWCTDTNLVRFLHARGYKVEQSLKLIIEALEWRATRRPDLIDKLPENEELLSKESSTGKLYCAGSDRWGRPVVIFNNTVENSNDSEGRMLLLAWNLEFACKMMPTGVDKFVAFVHLEKFSLMNTPSLRETRDTIQMLCRCYPERLGHCIVYKAPSVFNTLFNAIKGLLDPRTVAKLVFIKGDVSDGSENDMRMRELLGPDWKVLTGAEQPVYQPRSSPGYRHDVHWPATMQKLREMRARESSGASHCHSTASGASTAPSTVAVAEEAAASAAVDPA
eukprot:CAMPEP_0113717492 /NCGR_PEP_ID=MMETSP0038_2-20120614/34566_1 /TAXON_ID=2898 /ORGANISM="Cryptomonas paramecium" /LENGTH=311 /DNA_ID=CAMNT_0000645313 /DNA_START=83 /DNA_END=1015 /DNA_ORIENTATION=+ /assembly_acc=CAM_ASM_000170